MIVVVQHYMYQVTNYSANRFVNSSLIKAVRVLKHNAYVQRIVNTWIGIALFGASNNNLNADFSLPLSRADAVLMFCDKIFELVC
jgi:hypothetical protein